MSVTIEECNTKWGLQLSPDDMTLRKEQYDYMQHSQDEPRSVASLVKFICGHEHPSPAVLWDYGFHSVDSETLRMVYTDLLCHLWVDLNDLHIACISGQLSVFIEAQFGKRMTLPSFLLFQRIKRNIKNMYPLL